MRKRIISFMLVLLMVLTSIPVEAFGHQSRNAYPNKETEVKYNVVNINGQKYKAYKISDIMPDNIVKNNSQIRTFNSGLMSTPGYVDQTEQDPYKLWTLKINWETRDIDFPNGKIIFPVVYDEDGEIGNEDDIELGRFEVDAAHAQKGNTNERIKMKVKEGINPNDYIAGAVVLAPDFIRYDLRIINNNKWNGHEYQTYQFLANVSQNVMSVYKISWFDNDSSKRQEFEGIWKGSLSIETNLVGSTEDGYYTVIDEFIGRDDFSTGNKSDEPYTPVEDRLVTELKKGYKTKPIQRVNLNIDDVTPVDTAGSYIIKDGVETQKGFLELGTKYYYNIIGDYRTLHEIELREGLKVKFDPNGATFNQAVKAEQEIGHSMKIGEAFGDLEAVTVPTKDQISNIPQKDNKDQEFVGWVNDEANKSLDFSNNQNKDKLVDPNGYEVKKDVTFYAVYAPKALGKVNVKYVAVDGANEAEITDTKYHIDGQTYPAERNDKAVGTKIEATEASIGAAPKFIGYEFLGFENNGVTITPAAGQDETQSYTADAKYTITYKYKKLDPIIPEDKASQDVKDTYKKVTIKVDSTKGKFQKNNADVTESEFLYYVNPVEGKTLDDVKGASGLTPKSNDENAYKIDTTKPWKFDPTQTEGTATVPAADFALTTVVGKDNVKDTGVTMEVNFGQTTADKFKDKLDPQDIKVWVGDTIDWKKGVKLKEANEELQKILDKTETKVTDESNRNSDAANLPNGQKGDLKVTFEDGSTLVVNDQTLYVAPHKNDDNTNLPDDAVKVDFKIGEGVTGTAKTEYVKPGTDVKEDAPTVTLKEGFKDAKWYKGEATTEATDDDYKVTAKTTVFTAKATGKDKVVKLDDPENPTNFPKDPTDNSKKDADYVTVKFVADANGKIKEGDAEKAKGIAYAVLKNTEWADAVKAGVVVPAENATGNNPKLVGKDKFYAFKEWQKDGTKVTTFPKVEATDLTFTAVFGKADELSVTYNLNAPEGLTVGGTAPTDDTKYLKDEEVTVKALAADNKLAGYEFTGWNTKADGKGTAYAAGTRFAIKANTELFAQWNKTAPDVIPVDNKNDEKGKNGEEIPTNYVFVEFKVKDTDADKAEIKADQQSKFKVDPKVAVTLTAPALELKGDYKNSHIASFNIADYTNKKFEQATTIWANVREKGKVTVKYVFNTNPADKTLPKDLAALKPTDIAEPIYEDKVVDPAQPDVSKDPAKAALVEKDNDGKEVGTWTSGTWVRSGKVEDGVITYTLTWTFTEAGKPAPQPEQPSMPDYNPWWPIWFGSTTEVKKEEPKRLENHEAYIAGYPDGTVRPDGNMTRAEAIAVVARLQKLDLSDKSSNIYKDTKAGMWYNSAINAAFREGYLLEKEGEDIRPDDKITRAELALLISHIDKKNNAVAPFEDVKGHKFEAAINQAYGNERIKGYPDGTFRPDNSITRAEVATMLNKLYDRVADAEFIREHGFEIKKFKDLLESNWAYYQLLEATNSHDYERMPGGFEKWDKIVK